MKKIMAFIRFFVASLAAPLKVDAANIITLGDPCACANVDSDVYKSLFVDARITRIPADRLGGRVRYLNAIYTQGAADGNIGDVIRVARIPKGARLLPLSTMRFGAGNANATLKVGLFAVNAGFANDDAALVAATAIAAAGAANLDAFAAAGADKLLADEAEIRATNAVAAIKAGQVVNFHIFYTFD